MNPEPNKDVAHKPASTGFPLERQCSPAIDLQVDIGLLNTSLQTLGILGSKLGNQFLDNIDDVLNHLRRNCSDEDFQHIAGCFELLLRQPLRRALGRIRCVSRSLEEIKRHFAESEVKTDDSVETR